MIRRKIKLNVACHDFCSLCGKWNDVIISVLWRDKIWWVCGDCIASLSAKAAAAVDALAKRIGGVK